jgi:hypothetical protein
MEKKDKLETKKHRLVTANLPSMVTRDPMVAIKIIEKSIEDRANESNSHI